MNLDLLHKTALVGGGSKGIGLASARELALLGANVILLARSEAQLAAAAETLDTSRGQIHSFLSVDYSDTASLDTIIKARLAHQNVHILVNNTGGPPAGAAHIATPEAYLDAFRNHLICNQLLVQVVLEGMKKEGYGRIINVISTSVKQPLDNLGVSNTIRGAVASWAKTLANELGQFGITVNNVLPGATLTERLHQIIAKDAALHSQSEAEVARQMQSAIPLRRFASPEEIGAAVAFLASPAAAYINGINLPVDGGRTKSL